MTQDEQNRMLDLLQSIANSAIAAQTNLDHSSKLDLLSSLLDDIDSDAKRARAIVEPYTSNPASHQFKPSPGFSECCAICSESPALHEGE